MIKIFGVTDKTFATNGDVVLSPLTAKVHKEDNGAFYLQIETDLRYADELTTGRIIVAPTPQGEQAFRISNPAKTRRKVTIRADHVFYDAKNYLIADSYVVDKDCNDALDHLNAATEPSSAFTVLSNVTTVNSYRCVRTSLHDAVKTVLERWGGHLVRDNFTIRVMDSIGQDNGVTVRYGKNLKDISCTENWDAVVTKILPVGRDGLLLPELYLTSATQYSVPYTKTVSFSQTDVDKNDYPDEAAYTAALVEDLRAKATEYLAENCVPKVNYTLSANLEKITDVGDTIEVIDERLGINITTNVISYEYDAILGKYTQIEFGNFRQTLNDLMKTITASTEKIADKAAEEVRVTLGAELDAATAKIWNALGASYVIYDGDKILVVDKLPKETATNVIMINAGGIGFSQTGINGTFQSAWTINNVLNMERINVINMTADLIKGGTLKLGSLQDQSGKIELYDASNALIGEFTSEGIKMYGADGSYVLMNNTVGFAGYDRNDNLIYWVNGDEFHMKKSVVEEEITLCGKMRFIPITLYDANNNITSDGIGLVSTVN